MAVFVKRGLKKGERLNQPERHRKRGCVLDSLASMLLEFEPRVFDAFFEMRDDVIKTQSDRADIE